MQRFPEERTCIVPQFLNFLGDLVHPLHLYQRMKLGPEGQRRWPAYFPIWVVFIKEVMGWLSNVTFSEFSVSVRQSTVLQRRNCKQKVSSRWLAVHHSLKLILRITQIHRLLQTDIYPLDYVGNSLDIKSWFFWEIMQKALHSSFRSRMEKTRRQKEGFSLPSCSLNINRIKTISNSCRANKRGKKEAKHTVKRRSLFSWRIVTTNRRKTRKFFERNNHREIALSYSTHKRYIKTNTQNLC